MGWEKVTKASAGIPCSMGGAALFHDHGHDGVLISLPALLVYTDDLVQPDVTDQIAHDENKIRCDDAVSVDVAHRIAWSEGLF